MVKYFFLNLLKIVGVLIISALIVLCVLGIFTLLSNFPILTFTALFAVVILVAAYIKAKQDYAEDQALSQTVAWSLLNGEYDKLLAACRAGDDTEEWELAQAQLVKLQCSLSEYKQEYGADSAYTCFVARLESFLQYYPMLTKNYEIFH